MTWVKRSHVRQAWGLFISYDYTSPFSSPELFSLGHSLKISLWVRRLKGEIWLIMTSQRSWAVFARQNYSIKLCQHKYSRACALETSASFLVLSVPCIPSHSQGLWRSRATGRPRERARMIRAQLTASSSPGRLGRARPWDTRNWKCKKTCSSF